MSTVEFAAPSRAQDTSLIFKIAETREEWESAFRLVHRSYVRSRLIEPQPSGMRLTPFHLRPGSQVFIAKQEEEVVCTVSLIEDGDLGVPMEEIFPEEIASMRQAGLSFGEVSCLADRRSDFGRIVPTFLEVNRWMAQYARRRGLDRLVIAVHPRHARFYQRYMHFYPMGGEEKLYPRVRNHPAVAFSLNFERIDEDRPPCWERIFADPLSAEQLRPRPMPREDRAYFTRFLAEPLVSFSQFAQAVAVN